MSRVDPEAAREFARDVALRLQSAGYEALWAGGCVRDDLLKRTPKDYDVATSARPEEVQHVFRDRKTLAMGAQFGVIAVLAPRRRGEQEGCAAGQVEVATFRKDFDYRDGRRPERVAFSTSREDALRRDFTINGMFMDPRDESVIDYVGGREDLEAGLVRAIGDPHARIEEDKLRMLRGVRFAATFEFGIETATFGAIRRHAPQIAVVSAERIAEELRRIAAVPGRARGVDLLADSGLFLQIVPAIEPALRIDPVRAILREGLDRMEQPSFGLFLAWILRAAFSGACGAWDPLRPRSPDEVELALQTALRLKLSREEREEAAYLLASSQAVHLAARRRWSEVQRILVDPRRERLLDFCRLERDVAGAPPDGVSLCEARLIDGEASWNPPSLIAGSDLKRLGIAQGPEFRRVLEAVRDAQLNGDIATREEAERFAATIGRPSGG
jgi:tRNA nucleotidyltransferase/poly(A) polymerase